MEHLGRSEGRADDGEPLRDALRPRGPVRFEVSVSDQPGRVCVEIRGELDVLTAPRLAGELNTLVRRSDDDVVIDLRRAEFIDSAGLQLLLGTQRRLTQASRTLTVVCDDGPVRRVIELTRLTDVLGVKRGEDRGE